MVPEKIQQQIAELLTNYPAAKPVIDALLNHFEGSKAPTQTAASVPQGAIEYKDMSMILPQRRKCSLFICSEGIYLVSNGMLILHSTWEEFQRVVLLPITDKTKPTWNLIFAKPDAANTVALSLGELSADKFKQGAKPVPLRQELTGDVELNSSLTVDKEYSLAITAHVGSKDGMLYFLNDALVFGHKKPVLVIPHTLISSVSFTGITSSTFNIVVELEDETSHEFSMIDQEEYPDISSYVSDKGLSDRSLAADRAAKRRRVDQDGSDLEGDVMQNLEDLDDRESDADVVFDEHDYSGGSGESSSEADVDDVDLDDTAEINREIDVAQMHQLDEQQDDEDEEEAGFDQIDAYDTNYN